LARAERALLSGPLESGPWNGHTRGSRVDKQLHREALPRYPRTEAFWLLPEVGDGRDRLPPVLLWWVLLHGLSLLARYEPAAWRSALDLDRSPIADPLIDLLDAALQIVPDLLYEAATTGEVHT
jgi:hypothetical protein